MKKVILWFLVLISFVALLLRFSDTAAEMFLGIKQSSGISILSEPTEAAVFLNEKEVGKTPFEDKDLAVGEYVIRLVKEKSSWQGRVKLTPGTITVINRDLAEDPVSSAGETLTLIRGKGMTIISNPTGALVEIDGKPYGSSPLTADIETGQHTILLSHTNYLNRSIRADLPDNFNLMLSVNLALSEADLSTTTTPVTTITPEVVVKQTPTGFLRVRDKAGLNGKEIAQVRPGDSLVFLEEIGSWIRVRLSSGTEGFVSSAYVEKKNP
ncbi:MAG: PEGA domain-containing protein [Candidatus Daviesbacteria bacterium]|nr:PEGA domain-containing protein [Candidatus Daviesbacteria bacterium]